MLAVGDNSHNAAERAFCVQSSCEVPCSCSPISQSHFSSSQSTFLPQHASGMLHPIRVSEASDVFSYVTGLLCNQHNSAALAIGSCPLTYGSSCHLPAILLLADAARLADL
jgi:hypothetical protein